LFYADYLRNFRGAQTPLFPQAEQHYFAALSKLKQKPKPRKGDDDVRRFILRGLSALYQTDGVTLSSRKADFVSDSEFLKRPLVFFSTINRAAQSDADLDRDADVRDYTSEVLFAESAAIPGVPGSGRLARPLTIDEVRGLVRLKKPLETLDRLRFRYKALPVIDVFYTHRQTDNDQVSDFYCVTLTSSPGCTQLESSPFNALRQNDYGVTAQKPFTAFKVFDVSLTGTFDEVQRWGLIEFDPGAEESIKEYATSMAVAHFFGPDKANAEVGYTYQAIHPDVVPSQPNRDRQFLNGTLTYQVFRPLRLPFFQSPYKWRFESRGWDFFSGFLNDIESFPPTHVRHHDYFVGSSLRGIGRFDFTVQPTWFTSGVGDDPFQRNTQYRTNANVLFRIVDEERNAGVTKQTQGLHLGFLHLVIPFRDDATRAGPNYFENQKVGAELDSKFFTYSRWTTFLASARYDRVRFYHLDKDVNALTLNLSMGF
jgi:hypothetical protein